MQISPQGKVLASWGGPEITPSIDGENQWPSIVHGLFVDDEDTIWLGGNGDGDHVVLNFSPKGEFIAHCTNPSLSPNQEGDIVQYNKMLRYEVHDNPVIFIGMGNNGGLQFHDVVNLEELGKILEVL